MSKSPFKVVEITKLIKHVLRKQEIKVTMNCAEWTLYCDYFRTIYFILFYFILFRFRCVFFSLHSCLKLLLEEAGRPPQFCLNIHIHPAPDSLVCLVSHGDGLLQCGVQRTSDNPFWLPYPRLFQEHDVVSRWRFLSSFVTFPYGFCWSSNFQFLPYWQKSLSVARFLATVTSSLGLFQGNILPQGEIGGRGSKEALPSTCVLFTKAIGDMGMSLLNFQVIHTKN